MLTLFRLLSFCPLALLHGMGAAMGWASWLLSPTYRRHFAHNAALAGYSFAQVRPAVAHAGRMVLEMPRLWFGAPVATHWQGDNVVDAAYAARKGIVFLTPHLGCFEITAQSVAARYAGAYGPITVMFRAARQRALARVVAVARQREGLNTVPTSLAGVRQMIKALRAGRAVGLLPDQVPPEGMGQWVPFFGQSAYTMTLAARLLLQTGATPVVVWGERLPRGRGFCLHFAALSEPLADNLEGAVLQINREMERLIRQCPQQYLWGYGRYKKPRAEL
ncbi:MAG: lysophospholipid acyltransferase family protein [Burkholderiaceae bacterium]|jgi:KDO2-lipid IV(A) lauroyltransferase|nr:lysophospholipid acyltransferase family protein [Burkholderiaceae bacterium]